MKKFSVILISALLSAVLAIGTCAVTVTYNDGDTFTNPVCTGADPFIYYEDGTYFLYATNDGNFGYQLYTSTNLVDWKIEGYCLRKSDVEGNTNFWAPEVFKVDDTYYMLYSAEEHLGIATSDSPYGPFKSGNRGYIEELRKYRTIDGHFFRDDNGKLYLYFVCSSNQGQTVTLNGQENVFQNCIWGGEFDLITKSFLGNGPQLLLTPDTGRPTNFTYNKWPIVEGPEMLKRGDVYYLTYSYSGYTYSTYSVCCATSKDPLGGFKPYDDPILITDNPSAKDDGEAHLYGTAHHSFADAPDGNGYVIVYHAQRKGPGDAGTNERRICVDKAFFDKNGVLCAGTNGHPTATKQNVYAGLKAERKVTLTGSFEKLPGLPTVYVSAKDGSDSNSGSLNSPYKTLNKAYSALPNGGTIVLTQAYDMNGAKNADGFVTDNYYYRSPKVDGPIMIRGLYSSVPVEFRFWSLQSDTYIDNVALKPRIEGSTANGVSVIECQGNNVVFGEGVSCCSRPNNEQFPTLVGGYWGYSKEASSSPYKYYDSSERPNSVLSTDKTYCLEVLGGTWSTVCGGSMQLDKVIDVKNGTLKMGDGAVIRPGKITGLVITYSRGAAHISFDAEPNAVKYAIYKGGKLVGYSNSTSFSDSSYVPGSTAFYSVKGYVKGTCIGLPSASVKLSVPSFDYNSDGKVSTSDALMLLKDVIVGKTDKQFSDFVNTLGEVIK